MTSLRLRRHASSENIFCVRNCALGQREARRQIILPDCHYALTSAQKHVDLSDLRII